MKKFRDIALIIGVIAIGYGLLSKIIPGITITDFVWGFLVGLGAAMFIVALCLALVPLFCKKKKKVEEPAETADKEEEIK